MKKRLLIIIVVLVCVVSGLVFFLIPQEAQIVRSYSGANGTEQNDDAELTPAGGVQYFVNTTSDTIVPNACANGTAGCSLRGAITAANTVGNNVDIQFNIPASDPFCAVACTINLGSALPSLTATNFTITGTGADRLIVKPATGVNIRIFDVNSTGTVTISSMTIRDGANPVADGGGIRKLNTGTLSVSGCLITNSQALGGGGISIFGGVVNVTNSTISQNQAITSTDGGGIANTQGTTTLNVINSTIHSNTARNGGGINNLGTLNLTNSTVTGNSANSSGGGVRVSLTAILNSVKNSIIAGNSATVSSPDVFGNFTSAGFNLVGKSDGGNGFTNPTDLTGTIAAPLNAMLDPAGLQTNCGTTPTIALLPGSPAVDKATNNGLTGILTTDQRGTGFPRTIDDLAIPNAVGGNGTDIGALELEASIAISGTVTYGNAIGAPTPRLVSNVTITGAGSPTVMTTTLSSGPCAGTYSLSGFGAGAYTVTPSKTGGVNSITSFDAGKIAQHVAGISPLTGNQLLVADVSNNGTISSFDAGEIANFVVSGSPTGITGTWKFVPVNRMYASVTANITGEDYSALLMGEVSGNWNNTGARPVGGGAAMPAYLRRSSASPVSSNQTSVAMPPAAEPQNSNWRSSEKHSFSANRTAEPWVPAGPERAVSVELPNLSTPLDKEIIVPVNVEGVADKGIISYEFDLRYDPSVIQPQENPVDVAGTVSRGLSVVTNPIEPGLLRVVVYGAMPIDGDGVLLNLKFMAVGAVGSVSPLTWERIMFNEGEPRVSVADGKIELY